MRPLPQGFYPNYPLEIDFLAVIAWLIFILFLGYGLYRLYKYLYPRFRSVPQKIVLPEQTVDLWQMALDLFTKPVPTDIKKYYFESSEALSACLGFAELTVAEMHYVKPFAESPIFLQALSFAELVKFAKYIPTTAETDQYRQWAITVLQANKPQETP